MCGMFDYVRIHKKWFSSIYIPDDSFLNECYSEGDYFIRFQTKSIDNSLDNYEITGDGKLVQLTKQEWDPDIKYNFLGTEMDGGLKTINVYEHRKDFFGTIEAYSSLWGSGKPGSGQWPSSIYSELGECQIELDIIDGIVYRAKNLILKEPVLIGKKDEKS